MLLTLGAKVFCIDNQRLKKSNNFNSKNFIYYKADISNPKNFNILKKILLNVLILIFISIVRTQGIKILIKTIFSKLIIKITKNMLRNI